MIETNLRTEQTSYSAPLIKLLPNADQVCKQKFCQFLSGLENVYFTLEDTQGKQFFGEADSEIHVRLCIHDEAAYPALLLGGSLGAGEAYIRGLWSTDDLSQVIRAFAHNMHVVDKIDSGLVSFIAAPFLRFSHWLNRNNAVGSRRNIEAHYDLGNSFFQLFLDDSMMYSAAIYADENMSLADAQQLKLKTICDRLKLNKCDHLLEIGTGWGALAIYAAENYGCRVTSTTISQEQYKLACTRVKDAGLDNLIEIRCQDYRELDGQFDKAVSLEMVEAVGHEFLPEYFSTCSELLKADGLFLMQVITIPDQRYERARKEVDFIKRYIFPGSCIPSVQKIMSCINTNTNFRLLDFADYSADYSRTLADWKKNFSQNEPQIIKLCSDDFIRMWHFYFSYCEGSFAERAIGSAQMLFAKPKQRQQVREGLYQ